MLIQLLENLIYWTREYDLASKEYRFLKRLKQKSYNTKTIEDTFLRMEFTLIVEMHKKVFHQFEVLNFNIVFYNNQVKLLNIGFQIISPDETEKQYQSMLKMIE